MERARVSIGSFIWSLRFLGRVCSMIVYEVVEKFQSSISILLEDDLSFHPKGYEFVACYRHPSVYLVVKTSIQLTNGI